LIPIDKKITNEANTVVRQEMSKFEKARALYDHVVSTMFYDKSGSGWGLGDALYACDVRRGNCTDFHSLFIGVARASGIPARFVMGFPIPEGVAKGQIAGYHCWAEFYLDDHGWIPVDASEAFKHPEMRDFFFGGLDENRVQFTVGRDIPLAADENIEPLNYFIYPYVRIDGKVYSDVEYHFSFSDL
jgi:transglutaminase-like putative cysteine protease